MADLGDLSGFLREGSVANLDWLDVDEKSYRELEHLPKQNLDVSPHLEAAWAHEDLPPSAYVHNIGAVKTMRDVAELGLHTKQAAEQMLRTARVHIMQNPDPKNLLQVLISKFGKVAVSEVREELGALLQERGLLGRYYIAATDFPSCAQANKAEIAFVRRFASEARFVVACDSCSGCVHNGSDTCAVFQKKIVVDVPYTPELAAQVEQRQASQGKSVQASTATPRERVRLAILADDFVVGRAPESPKPVVDPSRFLRQAEAPRKVHLPIFATAQQEAVAAEMAWSPTVAEGKTASVSAHMSKTALDVVKLLRKEMLRGRSEHELMHALKLSFTLDDLRSTRERWEPLFKEAGLYGAVYSTQDSFDDCHEGADFLAKHASSVKAIVAGGRCSGCIYSKSARCLLYGRPLVAKSQDLYTSEVLGQTVREHRLAGRIGSDPISMEGDVRGTLKAIHRTATAKVDQTPIRSYMTAFSGAPTRHETAGLTKREVTKAASRYLNEGLYGTDLLQALKRRFDVRDIQASQNELRTVLSEQGLQGIFYVDASVYDDYGKGCDEGMRLHRSRLVPYVKMGSKCASCVLQTSAGHCSKYAKPLVNEPPYSNKQAQQREILASGASTELSLPSLFQPSNSILAQFEMQAEMQVDINSVTSPVDIAVELGGGKVKL